MVKLVVQKRKARMGRNPATGEAIKIPAKTVVKARIVKQLKRLRGGGRLGCGEVDRQRGAERRALRRVQALLGRSRGPGGP